MERIIIHIANKDRPTELALLLQSLRTQTYQNFDIAILDDGSGTRLESYYFLTYIISRLKLEGHEVHIMRNEFPTGVSKARQLLVDFTMKNLEHNLILRVDDDIILESDYIEQLLIGIQQGYDLMSGITTPIYAPDINRQIEFVTPIIGECKLNDKGELILNEDDCGMTYLEHELIPTHHFRSCALYKRDLHDKGVDYNSRLSKNGFREEQLFSFKAMIAGFKLGVNTSAINYHLLTPSGGERDTMNMTQFNQQIFEETVKRMFEDNGDFIDAYNKRYNIIPKERTKGELSKSTNLVSIKPEVNLLDEA